jgi:hypothetical protein
MPALVSHGRIMAAWIARLTGGDAFAFWQGLRMPDAFAIDLAGRRCERMVPR